ncbi:MAG: hypothetical protein V1897_19895 [Pseudomonadota bacterium]
MKKSLSIALMLFGLFAASIGWADSGIPNLVGDWSVKAEGGVIVKGGDPGAKTHYKDKIGSLNAEASIVSQQGRVVRGTFKSPRATEDFVAAIGSDNKTFYYVDEDGFIDGKIINDNTIEVVYRHTTPIDTVLGVGVWTRKK